MSEFVEIIFEFKPETKLLSPMGGCISCNVLKFCGVMDAKKCNFKRNACNNEMISVCLECNAIEKDVLDTIISGRGCW